MLARGKGHTVRMNNVFGNFVNPFRRDGRFYGSGCFGCLGNRERGNSCMKFRDGGVHDRRGERNHQRRRVKVGVLQFCLGDVMISFPYQHGEKDMTEGGVNES